MKKLVFILFLFLLSVNADAALTIPEDFYLDNSKILTDEKPARLLPNTLRLVLEEGESGELFAETFPDGECCDVSWNITGDGAKIFPRENTCTVVGVYPCREMVTLRSNGEKVFEIAVEVKPKRYEPVRSFDYEGELQKTPPPPKIMEIAPGLLSAGGVLLIAFALSSIKREKDKE